MSVNFLTKQFMENRFTCMLQLFNVAGTMWIILIAAKCSNEHFYIVNSVYTECNFDIKLHAVSIRPNLKPEQAPTTCKPQAYFGVNT